MFNNISKEKILLLADNSKSINELCIKLGYSYSTINKKVKGFLLENKYDVSKFSGRNNSVLNNKEKLEKIVKESFNCTEVLRKFNLGHSNNKTLQKYLTLYNIPIEHFNIHEYSSVNRDVLCQHSNVKNSTVKKYLLNNKLLEYKCSCGNDGVWNKKPITLHLEHKNGIRNDNRLENLEFLCPNCHSQTSTFGSKNAKLLSKTGKIEYFYKSKNTVYRHLITENKISDLLNSLDKYNSCEEILKNLQINLTVANLRNLRKILDLYKNNLYVRDFNKKLLLKKYKINFPTVEELIKLIKVSNYSSVARELKCSDNAIRKYLKRNGVNLESIKYPPKAPSFKDN